MTIKEVMDKTTTFFKQKGFHSPRLDAELLMAHGLNCGRMQLYLKFDQPLKEPELDTLRALVVRRSAGEPIAYITGKKDFYKASFLVNNSVLIPRPETESLVELAANFIERHKTDSPFKVLDIGGGSGCIGISLAKEFQDIHVSIIEKSKLASEVILENIKLNQVTNVTLFNLDAGDRDGFVQAWNEESLQTANEPSFDLIVSNPPYISVEDTFVETNVRKFEPAEALFADDNGYVFLKEWAQGYSKFQKVNSEMIFEMGQSQGPQISEHLIKLNIFKSVTIKKDLAARDRFVLMVK